MNLDLSTGNCSKLNQLNANKQFRNKLMRLQRLICQLHSSSASQILTVIFTWKSISRWGWQTTSCIFTADMVKSLMRNRMLLKHSKRGTYILRVRYKNSLQSLVYPRLHLNNESIYKLPRQICMTQWFLSDNHLISQAKIPSNVKRPKEVQSSIAV